MSSFETSPHLTSLRLDAADFTASPHLPPVHSMGQLHTKP
jgi:hypothetical protein